MRIVGSIVTCVLLLLVASGLHAGEAVPPFDPEVARRISAGEVHKRMAAGEQPMILDTRGRVGDVIAKGAIPVTNDRVEAWAKDTPRDALIVTYCS